MTQQYVRHVVRLADLLSSLHQLQWSDDVYVMGEPPWKSDTFAFTVDSDQTELPEVISVEGYIEDFQFLLFVQDLQSIVSNTVEQLGSANLAQLLIAINYYYENDAFIDWGSIAD